MRLRADASDVGADVENRRNDAQRMKQAARPAVFAIHLLAAELLRHAPILFPQVKPVADFDGNDAERGVLQGFRARGRRRQRIGQIARLYILPRNRLDALQFLRVDVMQHDGCAGQHRAFEDVAQHAESECCASCAD